MEPVTEPIKFKHPASAFMLFLILFNIGVELFIFEVMLPAQLISIEVVRSLWFMMALMVVRFILPLFIWLAITKDSFRRHMPTQPMGALNYLYIVLVSLLVIPAMMLVAAVSSLFVNNDAADFLAGASGRGYSWLAMMLVVAVTPGIVEELVFRGYIQSVSRGSVRKIALMNGLLFGLMHMNLHQLAYTFLLGVFFAYMLYYTRNIWSVIISHFLVNGFNITWAHWATQSAEYVDAATDQTLSQLMYESFVDTDPELAQRVYDIFYDIDIIWLAIAVVGFIAIFTTIGAAVLFYVMVRHNKKRNAAFDSRLETAAQPAVQDTDPTPQVPPSFYSRIDWCLVWVIVIYVALTIVLPRVL